jgi:hypothetical protein
MALPLGIAEGSGMATGNSHPSSYQKSYQNPAYQIFA